MRIEQQQRKFSFPTLLSSESIFHDMTFNVIFKSESLIVERFRYHGSMPSGFGSFLNTILKEKSLTQNEFARLVGTHQSYISRIIDGERPPPADNIEAWANALKLNKKSHQTFLELAWLEHTPPYIREVLREERSRYRP